MYIITRGRAALAGLILVIISLFVVGCGNGPTSSDLTGPSIDPDVVALDTAAAKDPPGRELLNGWTYNNNAGLVDDWRVDTDLMEAGATEQPNDTDIVIVEETEGEKKFVRLIFHGQERKILAYERKDLGIGKVNPHYGNEVEIAILDMAVTKLKEERQTILQKIGKTK